MGVALEKEVEEATLTYRVKFDKGYDWTRGGKLPGLCDDGVCSSAAAANSLLDNRSDGEIFLFSTKKKTFPGVQTLCCCLRCQNASSAFIVFIVQTAQEDAETLTVLTPGGARG